MWRLRQEVMSWWRRSLPRLRADTPDGTRVELVGMTRMLSDERPFIPPVRNEPCVVGHIAYTIVAANKQRTVTKFERLHNRPFLVVADDVEAIVDAAQLELRIERLNTMIISERSVPVGARVRVIGTVMRDVGPPDVDASFRDSGSVITLVGSRRYPVQLWPA